LLGINHRTRFRYPYHDMVDNIMIRTFSHGRTQRMVTRMQTRAPGTSSILEVFRRWWTPWEKIKFTK